MLILGIYRAICSILGQRIFQGWVGWEVHRLVHQSRSEAPGSYFSGVILHLRKPKGCSCDIWHTRPSIYLHILTFFKVAVHFYKHGFRSHIAMGLETVCHHRWISTFFFSTNVLPPSSEFSPLPQKVGNHLQRTVEVTTRHHNKDISRRRRLSCTYFE